MTSTLAATDPELPASVLRGFHRGVALSLRDRINLGPTQRFRLVGVDLSNFRDLEQLQSPLFD